MSHILYPNDIPYTGRYGTLQLSFPTWKKDLLLKLFKLLFCLFATLFFVSNTSSGQGACPSSNCVSGDMTITKVEMVDANTLGALPNSCPPNQSTVPVKIKVTFDATAGTRYGFLLIGDIKINNVFLQRVWQCYPEDFTQGPHTKILDQVIQWPCGSTISLSDVYTAWKQQAPSTTICTYLNNDGTISNCSAIDPKCKYYGEQSFTIAAPLIADFSYDGTCGPNDLYKPLTFTSFTSGGNTPYQYSWEIKDAVTNSVLATSTSNPFMYTPQSGNNLLVKLTITDASTPTPATDDETKTVTVTSCCAPPTVSSNPQSVTKCQGTSASFSVGYTGGNPTPSIQWQMSTDGGINFSNVPNSAPYSGVTSGTLNISSVTLAMNNYKFKAVLKSGACSSVESTSATLNVDPTSVGGTVTAAQTICSGNQPTNDLTLSGSTGSVVKWQRSTDNFVSNSTDIANTTTTLPKATIGALTQDTWFRAVVKSGECSQTNSSIVKITVNAPSVAGTIASAQTLCYNNLPGSNLTLSGNTGAVVKWQRSTDNFVSNSTDIANTTATLTAAAIGTLTQDTWFRVIVKNGECPEIISAAIKITVNPLSVGGSVASDQTICSGNQPSSNLTLSGHTGSIVKWQRSTTSNFSAGTTTDIANTTTTLTAAAIGALTQDTWFRAVVKSGVCSEVNSDAVKITVQQPIGNNTVQASQTICSGNTPAAFTGSTPTGGNGSYSFQWQMRTTGSWSNISGANLKDFDFAPGVISETTQFRRIVSAGSACSNSTSAAVTISISPESQVYAISGSNFCLSAPNTGTVKINSSYPGVSYQLKKSDNTDVQDPQTGTGSALIWNNLEAGSYYVFGTGLAPTNCTSQTATVNVIMFDCSVFYTLTQGYYGSKNGKSCLGSNAVNTIKFLLGNIDLVTGTTNSVTVPATNEGAIKLNQTMPGGSTPDSLAAGNCIITTGCFVSPKYLTQQGRINNVLLSQTITLGLNVRWENGKLLLFSIKGGYLTTQKMKGCFPNGVLVETCESGTIFSKLMNQNVVNYLGTNGTVADLLQLANDVLGGTKKPGVNGVPSYSNVNDAVSTINEAFDEGRRFLNYFDNKQTCEMIFPAPALPTGTTTTTTTAVSSSKEINIVTVTAYPNPFSDNISFEVEAKQQGKALLEVYSMTGQKLKTVYNGNINPGKQRFTMTVPAQQRSMLFYVFRMGDQKLSGKLLYSGR